MHLSIKVIIAMLHLISKYSTNIFSCSLLYKFTILQFARATQYCLTSLAFNGGNSDNKLLIEISWALIAQSIVTLSKSLVEDSLSLKILKKSVVVIFFAKKIVRSFSIAFWQKCCFYTYYLWKFSISLTNDLVSF